MKILILSHKFSPDIGGIESISKMFAEEFVKKGHEVHIVTESASFVTEDFKYAVIRKPSLYILLKEYKWADVVLENNPCVRLAWPLLFYKKPKITGLQTWIASEKNTTNVVHLTKKFYLKFSTCVTACSESVRKKTFSKAIVIGNPYDHNLFKVKNYEERVISFLFLGRLVSDKGVDLAIKALAKLNNVKDKKYSLSIVGSGEEETNLKELVLQLGLENHVFFYGAQQGDKLVDILNMHEYLLVPSVWEEPFGIVVLEGMACGCLPIVSDGGGLPDAVGNAGAVFKRGCAHDLATVMQRLIENPLDNKNMRGNMKKHLSAHTAEIVANKYLSLIEQTVNS